MGYEKALEVIEEVKKAIKGKDEIIRDVMLTALAGGNVLMEDIPGVGKTTLANAFARAIEFSVNRMQFTTDVMPSDVTGFSMYNNKTEEFEYRDGAIMCNLFLADEINRTSSKTQAALLEAMEEGQVTVDGMTHVLPKPFMVIATENPKGSAGTQLLPESQLDRFMVCLSMGYPDPASESSILIDRQRCNPVEDIETVVTKDEFLAMQEEVCNIHTDKAIVDYIVAIASATRFNENVSLGVSPRGTIALCNMARANAYLCGRTYCSPDDVKAVAHKTLVHRITLSVAAKSRGMKNTQLVDSILEAIPVPRKIV